MIFQQVRLLNVLYEPEEGRLVKVGRLATKDHGVLFEYDAGWLTRGLELSPFKLPLQAGVFEGDPGLFEGLMGVFDDSLPDGWGRLLIDRRAAKGGLLPAQMGPLDRLSLIGARAMGALVYQPEVDLEPPSIVNLPEIAAEVEAVVEDAKGADLERLIALGGSPQGARPKVLVQVGADGSVVYGDRRARPNCTPYLVKFRARDDAPYAAVLEHAYCKMAAAAGLDVPTTTLLGRTKRHPGYFAIRRFDRDGPRKIHLHTLGGLLHASHRYPSITYRDLLVATRRLTRNEAAVTEMFRRSCFNVFAHNRDDHARNFAFVMTDAGDWSPSPAYDLTLSSGPGGEHWMLVGREGANPTKKDLIELASSVDVRKPHAIVEEVRAAVNDFARHADAAGLPKKAAQHVVKTLGLNPPKSARAK